MNRPTLSEREAILAAVDRLALMAERYELEHVAKKDIIVTAPASAAVKARGERAGLWARQCRRRIQKLLASLYQ